MVRSRVPEAPQRSGETLADALNVGVGMSNSTRPLATRRPLVFSALITLIFIVALVAVVVGQTAAVQPSLQEAIGAVGRAVIGGGALIWLAGLGWRRWLAGAGSRAAWLLIVPPLTY